MSPETPIIAREGPESAVALVARNENIGCLPTDAANHMVNLTCLSAGIIAFGIGRSGAHVRASGWGPAFLDMGSGYDIGRVL